MKEAEGKIREFIESELKNRGKAINLTPDTSLLLSNLLDSLFVVDLVLFLEDLFPDQSKKMGAATKEDLDTLKKISQFIAKN